MKRMLSSKKLKGLPRPQVANMLAFLFLCKNPAVFASENPRILFMAKRQKAQEAVWPPGLLRLSYFFNYLSSLYDFFEVFRYYLPLSLRF